MDTKYFSITQFIIIGYLFFQLIANINSYFYNELMLNLSKTELCLFNKINLNKADSLIERNNSIFKYCFLRNVNNFKKKMI
jgi:hypothetical protein